MGEFEAKENTRYVDVPCLKKRRRALVFLADFFLTLMLTITLFHLAIYPLSRVIVNYDSRIESLHQTQAERDSVLYDLELLFPKAEGRTTYDAFEDNLAYTSEEYIHYLVDNAHGSEYEVFATYFKGVKGSATAYVSFYRELDENQGFFDFDNNEIHLKEEYVQSLSPKYNPDDTMSTKGISDYERLEGRIFVQGYQRMLSDAYSNDLSHNGISYKTSQDKISGILNGNLYLISTAALLSYLISWLVFYLIVPLVNKNRKTVGMIVLRVIRSRKRDFGLPSMPVTYLQSAYSLVAGMAFLVFAPWGVVDFNELFALPLLFPLSLVSLVFILISTAMMLFDSLNRTFGDFFTQCICFDDESYDEIARRKGYLK